MQEYIIPILTLLTGGGLGWVFTISASRKKADADAFQSMQAVYKQTIEDQQKYYDEMKEYSDSLRKDRDEMRNRNRELEQKITKLEGQILDLKKEVARYGRKVDAMRPFLCARVNCDRRTSVNFNDDEEVETC